MAEENQGNEFGRLLESFRVLKGWTQEDAIAHLGVTRHTYIAWKTGERLPSDKKLRHIASTLKLSQVDEDELNRTAKLEPPKLHNFPFSRNPLFTGREAQLEELGKLLKDNDSVALTQPVSISGLGGIGKTQLALEYAHRCYPDVYRTVLWVDAANETALVGSYDKLAHLLELPDLDERDLARSVQAVKDWLERHTNWLLIMDNADNLQLARDFFPRAQQAKTHRGRILLATRSQMVEDVVASKIDIDKMTPEEGLHFLLRRSNRLEAAADIREPAAQLVELLDRHPLALDQAGAYIQEAHVSFTDYKNLYDTTRRELLETRWLLDDEHRERPEYSQHPESIAVTFDLCFTQARKGRPLAGDILDFCAFLHPDAIPDELFQHDESFKYGTTAFNKGFATLLRYSLIKRNDQEKTLSMHRLVQAVLIDAMSPDLQKQCRERVVRALSAAFPKVDYPDADHDYSYNQKHWTHCARLLPHALACAAWSTPERDALRDTWYLLYKASSYLSLHGHNLAAEPLVVQALSIAKQLWGDDDLIIAVCLQDLAVIQTERGEYDQAEPLLVQALTIAEKHHETQPAFTAKSLTLLARCYFRKCDFEQTVALHKRSLAIYEKLFGAIHPDTALCLHNLACTYQIQGDYEQAESFYRRAVAVWDELQGDNHPEAAVPLHGLAGLLSCLPSQKEEADTLFKRAISIRERYLGPMHFHTVVTKKQYADFLRRIGRDAEAATLELETKDEPSVYHL